MYDVKPCSKGTKLVTTATYHLEMWCALGGKSSVVCMNCCIPLGQSSPSEEKTYTIQGSSKPCTVAANSVCWQ